MSVDEFHRHRPGCFFSHMPLTGACDCVEKNLREKIARMEDDLRATYEVVKEYAFVCDVAAEFISGERDAEETLEILAAAQYKIRLLQP